MKINLKISLVAAVALTSVVPNLALAGNTYDVEWDFVNNKPIYYKDGDRTNPMDSLNITTTDGNIVNMNYAATNFNHVFGGFQPIYIHSSETNPVTVTKNEIHFYNGFLGGQIYQLFGASTQYGDSINNKVIIHEGEFYEDGVMGNVYGGYVNSKGSAVYNIVTIEGKVKIFSRNVYGGYTYNGGGDANYNKVNISGGYGSSFIYGGYAGGLLESSVVIQKGNANHNSVTVTKTDGEHGNIVGGASQFGSATNNTVHISGGNVGNVVGGNICALSNNSLCVGSATNNTVTYTGGSIKYNIYGGATTSVLSSETINNLDLITGNTLNIGESKTKPLANMNSLQAQNILNFENINFYLPNGVANDTVALRLITTTTTDLSNTKVSAFLSNASALNGNSVIHLIQTNGKLTAPKSIDKSGVAVNVANLINVNANIALDSTSKNLDLTFSGTPSITWSSKDTTFNITDANKFTRKMTYGATEKDQDFTISGNFDSEELATITGATSSDGTGGTFTPSLSNNKINVDLVSNTFTGVIYGGYGSTNTAEVKNNTININNGTVNGSVRGGYITASGTASSSVTGNKIVISGGTVNTVYGGMSDGASLVADNTIDFIGGKVNNFIYGGRSGSGGTTKNNTLNIGTSTQRVMGLSAGSIANIDNLNFYMPDVSTLSNGNTALTLNSGNINLTNTTIKVNGTNNGYTAYLNGKNKYYLLTNTATGIISVNDAWLKSTQNVTGNTFNVTSKTEYDVAKGGIFLSDDERSLFISSEVVSNEAVTGDTFGDNEAGIKDGITVNLNNGADYQNLKLNLAKSTTINIDNAKNLGEISATSSDISIANSTLNAKTSAKSLNLSGAITAANDILATNNININKANLNLQGGLKSNNSNIVFNDSKAAIKGNIEANKVSFNSGSNLNTITANDIKAKNIEFYLPNSVKYNDVALKLTTTGNTDLSSTSISAYLSSASNLKGDGAIHLIQTNGKLNTPSTTNTSGVAVNVANLINVNANIELDSTNQYLDLKFNGTPSSSGGGGSTANADSKQLLENSLAGMIAVSESINNLVLNLDNLSSNEKSSSSSSGNTNIFQLNNISAFANTNGHNKRFITGSHVDSKGFSLSSGIVKNDYFDRGDLTTGLFLEYGKGKYESVLDNGLVGEGKTEFIGGGVFCKFKFINNYYTEASARIGNIKTKAEKGIYDEYKLSNIYYGAHLGVGKIYEITSSNELDVYAKYFHSYVAGDNIELSGVSVDLGSVTFSKFKTGFKDTIKFSDISSLYAGAAYQYEAKGDAKGSLSAFNQSANIASPSLKGSTGIGEIGYIYEMNSIKFDIGAKGFVGKERGYSGNLGATYKF